MTMVGALDAERKGAHIAAYLMAVSARTAPKACAVDNIVTSVIEDPEDLEVIAETMEKKCKEGGKIDTFLRDANNVRQSAAVVLIGMKGTMPKTPKLPLNCGACGYKGCMEFIKAPKHQGEDFFGPVCLFNSLDLGIALGSAAKTAMDLNLDNRMYYSIGAAAKQLGLLDADVIIGIAVSVSGKNVYFDRVANWAFDNASIRLPFKDESVPRISDQVTVLDAAGEELCEAVVEEIILAKSGGKTLRVVLPRKHVTSAKGIRAK